MGLAMVRAFVERGPVERRSMVQDVRIERQGAHCR